VAEAMAVSTTSFAGAKLEAPFLKSSSASSWASPSSHLPILWKRIRSRRALIQRGVRCEVAASNALVQTDKLSALEQLKASAADRNSSHFSLFLWLWFLDNLNFSCFGFHFCCFGELHF
jgi:hypothetical protein